MGHLLWESGSGGSSGRDSDASSVGDPALLELVDWWYFFSHLEADTGNSASVTSKGIISHSR